MKGPRHFGAAALLLCRLPTASDRERSDDAWMQVRPRACEAGVKVVGTHFVDVHPVQGFRLAVGDAGVGVTVTVGDDRVVTPRTVVVGEDVDDVEVLFFDADFFPCLALGRGDGIFVRVERASGQRPCAAAVGPCGTQLEKYMWFGKIAAYQQKSCGAVETPVVATAVAVDPAVTVAHTHVNSLSSWNVDHALE